MPFWVTNKGQIMYLPLLNKVNNEKLFAGQKYVGGQTNSKNFTILFTLLK